MRHLPYRAYANLLNNRYGIPESRGVSIDRALDRLHDALCQCDKNNRKAFEYILGARIIFEVELWAKTKFGLEDELLTPDSRAQLVDSEDDDGYGFPEHWEVLRKVKDRPDNMTPNDLQLFEDPNR